MDGRKPVHMCTNVPVFHSLLPSLCCLCFFISCTIPPSSVLLRSSRQQRSSFVYSYHNDRYVLRAALFPYGMHTLTLNSEHPERPPCTRSPQFSNLVAGRNPLPSSQVLEFHVPSICVSLLLSLRLARSRNPLFVLSLGYLPQFECSP